MHGKGTKIFLKKKKIGKKKARDRYKNLSEEEKQKKVEYMKNYYLALENNSQDSIEQFDKFQNFKKYFNI